MLEDADSTAPCDLTTNKLSASSAFGLWLDEHGEQRAVASTKSHCKVIIGKDVGGGRQAPRKVRLSVTTARASGVSISPSIEALYKVTNFHFQS